MIYKKFYFNSFIYLFTSISSLIYHSSRETKCHDIDFIFSLCLFFCNCIQFYNDPSLFSALFAILSICMWIYSITYGCHNYELIHPMWHIMAGIGTLTLYL